MVVEIFVARGDTEHSLTNQSVVLVTNLFRCAGIMKHGGQAVRQAMLLIDFTKQEQSSIGGDVAPRDRFQFGGVRVARRSVFQVPFWKRLLVLDRLVYAL